MNIEHKPGVLCLIIRGVTEKGKANIGKIVELIQHLDPGDEYMISEFVGLRNADNKRAWLVKGDNLSEPSDPNKSYGLYTQSALLPIQDPDQDFIEQKTRIRATIKDGRIVETEEYL